jgi:3-hydroxybutyryl-CoA dehydrogenase
MGRGLAHAFAYAGRDIWLLDCKQRSDAEFTRLHDEALAEVDASLRALAELGVFDSTAVPAILRRVRVLPLAAAATCLAQAELVFEAVPEVVEQKLAILRSAEADMPPGATLASTTSTFLSTTLAEGLQRPQRFLNAHWLNPAYLVPLVELSPHPATAPQVTAGLQQLLESIGKVPVVCAARAGFIVPRIQALAMNEAARIVEEGSASASDIDKATRYGFGFRFAALGLTEFIDYGGSDILYYASRYLTAALGERHAAPPIIDHMMAAGELGLKSGRGFHDYAAVDVPAYRRQVLDRMLAQLRHMGLLRTPVVS